jgi:hypothetical protein
MDIIYEIPAALEPEDLIPRSLITIRDFYCLLFGVSFNLTTGDPSITLRDSPQIKAFIFRCDDGFRDQEGGLGKVILFEELEEFHPSYLKKLKASLDLDKIIKEAVSVGNIQSIPNRNQDYYYSKATKTDMRLCPNLPDRIKRGLIDGCHAQMFTYDNKKFSKWFYEDVFEWLESKQFISEGQLRIVESVLLKILKKDVKAVNERTDPVENKVKADTPKLSNSVTPKLKPDPHSEKGKTKTLKEQVITAVEIIFKAEKKKGKDELTYKKAISSTEVKKLIKEAKLKNPSTKGPAEKTQKDWARIAGKNVKYQPRTGRRSKI